MFSTYRMVQWSARVFSAHHLSVPLIQLQSTCLELAVKNASVSIHTNTHAQNWGHASIEVHIFFTTFLLSPFVSCLLLYISIICLCYLSFHQNLLYNHASVLMTNWPHPCVARIPLPQMRMSTHTQRSHTLSLVSLIIQGQCAACCVWVSRANVQKLIAVWLMTRGLFNTALW